MGLLRADLRVLANLFVRRGAGRVAAGSVLSLATLACVSFLAGGATLSHPDLLQVMHGDDADSARTLLGMTLMPSLMVGVWFGLLQSQRMLFEAPELDLWLTAPMPAWRGPMHGFLRVLFLTTLWALALSGPAAGMVLQRLDAEGWAYWLLPPAVALCVAPLLASVMTIHIVLLRWFASRLTKLLLGVLVMVASLAFTVFLLVGVFARSDQAERVAELVQSRPDLPSSVQFAAGLLSTATGETLDTASATGAAAWVLITVLLLFLVSFWHPRAVQSSRRADRPVFRRLYRREWPGSVWLSMVRKELTQLLQMPGQLLGMLVFGILIWVLARERIMIGGILRMTHLPVPLRQCTSMIVLWVLAVMMVLYAHMGRLTLSDGKQWPLYIASPARPGGILAGKLTAIYLLLLWPVLIAATAGAYELDAGWRIVLAFCAIALGGNAAALGILSAVGTMPFLMRPDADGQIVQNTRSILAAFLLIVGFELAVAPGFFLFLFVHQAWRSGIPEGPLGDLLSLTGIAVAGAWSLALLLGGGGCLLGARNFRRLLRPRAV